MIYSDNRGPYLPKNLVSIGQELYMEYAQGIIIPVYVNGITDIVVVSDRLGEKLDLRKHDNDQWYSLWVYRQEDGTVKVAAATNEEGEGGWPIHIQIPIEELYDCEWVNQMFWVDEVVGHDIQLSDRPGINHDGVYLTLAEARQYGGTIDKRQAHRAHKRLNRERRRATAFVNHTHVMADVEPSCPLVTTEKKLWVNRGKGHRRISFDRMMRGKD